MDGLATYNPQFLELYKPNRKFVTALWISISAHLLLLYALNTSSWSLKTVLEDEFRVIDLRLAKIREEVVVTEQADHSPRLLQQEPVVIQKLAVAQDIVKSQAEPQVKKQEHVLNLSVPDLVLRDSGTGLQNPNNPWTFSGKFQHKLRAREANKTRSAILALNSYQRTGQSKTDLAGAATLAANSTIVKSGDVCRIKYARQSGERGNKYALGSIPCPGTRPWWQRDKLDEIAASWRIP